ncbi:MAG: SDR family oxidoreductase [Methanomassiliicoccales archaeon]|nr:SDR family oxidoreductase [Methanomassiliicoccales archaeon]
MPYRFGSIMLIDTSTLSKDMLKNEVAIVTGGGRGIGYEAARSLLWLGAKVIIAEIDEGSGADAASALGKEFGPGRVIFVKSDIGEEGDVERLKKRALAEFGKADVVLNNATIFPMGAVKEVPIASWDRSYHVNLRGPVLLALAFLPDMIARKHGAFVCVSSSGAAPFMGAYEVFKTSQVELSNTISAEVEGTGVVAFTIGPGIVPTPGFLAGGGEVAGYMGMTTDQLLKMNEAALLSPEAAGAGFAGAIALASRYHGKEISSIQVLKDIGISLMEKKDDNRVVSMDLKSAAESCGKALKTFLEQSAGWKQRNLFERQWVYRDFKKQTGQSVDEMLANLEELEKRITKQDVTAGMSAPMVQLVAFYRHQQDLLRGFEKDPNKLEINLKAIDSWIEDVSALIKALGG